MFVQKILQRILEIRIQNKSSIQMVHALVFAFEANTVPTVVGFQSLMGY